tara:strand:- start:778 stop:1095 length:318 start_codon:yes stop_codon:yes gene_type:complete
MAITIDPRPTVFGDRIIITGSFEATDTTIDLSSQLASIDACIVNSASPNTAKHQDVDPAGGTSYAAKRHFTTNIATFSGTTISVGAQYEDQSTTAGTFLVIGRRS